MTDLSPQLFGEKSCFAIEVSKLHFVEGVLYGNIALWIDDHSIGCSESDEDIGIGYTLLKQHFSDYDKLSDEELNAMPGQMVVDMVYHFSHDPNADYDEIKALRYYGYELGPALADWWDKFFIITLNNDTRIRFLWTIFANRKIFWEAYIPKVILEFVLKDFCKWFESFAIV